ncbi:MAG: metalloregulator ArsR/SmtB family transcription factor [Candidatus Wolfebacteria bacterium]|nr:metalloregulator ArsR/SmtB family transcription factor [Candidatus Wolfebacteria bacterium]
MTDLCKEMEKFGKGIGSVPRYRIVEALFSGHKTVSELARKTKLSQPLVSQHLRVLRETGLVQDERQGQEVRYTLNVEHTIHLLKRLAEEIRPKKKRKSSA